MAYAIDLWIDDDESVHLIVMEAAMVSMKH